MGAVCTAIALLTGAACTTTISGTPSSVAPTAEPLPADPGPPSTPPSHAGAIADQPDVEVPLLERHGLTEMYAKTGRDRQVATRAIELFELRDPDAASKVLQTEYLVVRDGVRASLNNPRQHVIAGARCHSDWRTSLTVDRYIHQICLVTSGRYFLRVTVENAAADQHDVAAMRELLRTQLAKTPE